MNHPLFSLALAMAIGALVGVDREQRKRDEQQHGVGGLRTFMLMALLGGLVAMIARQMQSPAIFAIGSLAAVMVILISRILHARQHVDQLGLTTDTALIIVYFLGGLVMMEQRSIAVALGIGTAAILAFKERLHGWVDRVGRDDLYAVLKLLIASGIVLPVLPNETIDPLGVLNPYKIWWLVILISALSLVGYVLTRLLGAGRGAALTGFIGGIVSSTAVSLTFARRSRDEADVPGIAPALTSGVLLAWVVMFARVIIIVGVVFRPMLSGLAWSMGAMGATALALAAFYLWRGSGASNQTSNHSVPMTNPFSLWSAIKFAAVFTAIIVAVDLARRYISTEGMYLLAALAGLTDVDAITLSMAQFAQTGNSLSIAVTCTVIAVLSNTLVKVGIIFAMGSKPMRVNMLISTLLIMTVGVTAILARWGS